MRATSAYGPCAPPRVVALTRAEIRAQTCSGCGAGLEGYSQALVFWWPWRPSVCARRI